MAYKFDSYRGRLQPTTSNAAYGLQSLKPPVPISRADEVLTKLIWAQDPQSADMSLQNAKKIQQHRAVLEKSDLYVHLKGAKDMKITYRPALLFIGAGLSLACYSAYKLGLK